MSDDCDYHPDAKSVIYQDWEIEMAVLTERGLTRTSNQDSIVTLMGESVPGWCLVAAAVFDGVGVDSHGRGASSSAARCLPGLLGATPSDRQGLRRPARALEYIMQTLHEMLTAQSSRISSLRWTATTATIALVTRTSPDKLWLASVGDSPAFRVRGGGRMVKLTTDDTLVAEFIVEGRISPQDALTHPQRHVITQALGSYQDIQPHIQAHKVRRGDLFLLCTDGLTNMVVEEEIRRILSEADTPGMACTQLVASSNDAGGFDNIGVVVMRFRR